jgi:hypothetical protein
MEVFRRSIGDVIGKFEFRAVYLLWFVTLVLVVDYGRMLYLRRRMVED